MAPPTGEYPHFSKKDTLSLRIQLLALSIYPILNILPVEIWGQCGCHQFKSLNKAQFQGRKIYTLLNLLTVVVLIQKVNSFGQTKLQEDTDIKIPIDILRGTLISVICFQRPWKESMSLQCTGNKPFKCELCHLIKVNKTTNVSCALDIVHPYVSSGLTSFSPELVNTILNRRNHQDNPSTVTFYQTRQYSENCVS